MPRQRTTTDEYEVQGNYGHGWECVTTEESCTDAVRQRRCYDENEPQYAHRIVARRVPKAVA